MLTTAEAAAVGAMLQSSEASIEAKLAAVNDLKASLSKHGAPDTALRHALDAASIAIGMEEPRMMAAGSSLQEAVLRVHQPNPAAASTGISTGPARNRPIASSSSTKSTKTAKPIHMPAVVTIATAPTEPTPTASIASRTASTSSKGKSPAVIQPTPTELPVPRPPPAIPSAYEMDSTIEPAYVESQRELERTFQEMHPNFEDRESEANWMHRERSILKLRKLTRGNALTDFRVSFLAGIKGLLDGIMKAVTSLRTTLSTGGCLLVQELTVMAGPGMDPMVEILLQTLIKLSAATKKIAAHNGNVTVDVICANVSYSIRVLQHIWTACQEKNVQPRNFAAGWLKTFIVTHGHDRSHLEHTGGLDLIEKSIKKGLGDPNPGVRESMRKTFWAFSSFFDDRAEGIMASLDQNSKRLLENDPANPRAGHTSTQTADADAATNPLPSSSAAASSSRPSLKEAIAAKKREATAANGKAKVIPSRPGSTELPTSAPSIEHDSGRSTITARLASAPIKAPKRPELKRPATADPIRRLVVKPLVPKLERPSQRQGPITETKSDAESTNKPSHETVPETNLEFEPAHSHQQGSAVDAEVEVESGQPHQQGPAVEAEPKLEITTTPLQEPVVETELKVEAISSEPQPSYAQSSASLTDSTTQVPTTSPPGSIRATSPKVERHYSPLQVYEDEMETSNSRASPESSARHATVLEERPNEQIMPPIHSMTSTQLVKKTLSSPVKVTISKHTMIELEKARHLMNEGMAKARSMSLNGQGFRTLQQLFKDHPETFRGSVSFSTFFCALLHYLEASVDRLSHLTEPHRVQDLKVQVLITVRLSLHQPPEKFLAHVPDALCAIVRARDIPDAGFNFIQNLEETAQDMYRWGWGDKCVEAVLMLVEEGESQLGKWGRFMGFMVLGGCLAEREGREPLTPEILRRVSGQAARYLSDEDTDLRRGMTACCVGLHSAMGPRSGFWHLLEPAGEQACRVVAYYIARTQA